MPTIERDEAEAFHQALEANPHDRERWLAFAKWLRTHDAPRSEFMQVQFALENDSLPKTERDELKHREQELLAQYERDWLGPLAPFVLDAPSVYVCNFNQRKDEPAGPPIRYRFTRGWLTELHFRQLTVNAARAWAKSPEARHVRTLLVETCANELPVGSEVDYPEVFYEPASDVPEGLPYYCAPSLHALTHVPQLHNLRTFRLGQPVDEDLNEEFELRLDCRMNGALAYALVKQMPYLEELRLYAHTREHMEELFGLPMPNLRELVLYHGRDYPLDTLAANPTLTQLTHLRCHPHAAAWAPDGTCDPPSIRLAHIAALSHSPHLTALTHLALRLTDFGDAGVAAIITSGLLQQLKVLDLYGGCVTDNGAAMLSASPDLKNLTLLNLSVNALTPLGVKLLEATNVPLLVIEQHTDTGPFESERGLPAYFYNGDIE